MEAALERGEIAIDLTYRVPPVAAGAVQALDEMLDEADEYCRRGDHLLTLAAPPESVRFRKWFLGGFTDQFGGAAPTPWPGHRCLNLAAAGITVGGSGHYRTPSTWPTAAGT